MSHDGECCGPEKHAPLTYSAESSVMMGGLLGGLLIRLYLAMGKKSMHGLEGRASPGHTYYSTIL